MGTNILLGLFLTVRRLAELGTSGGLQLGDLALSHAVDVVLHPPQRRPGAGADAGRLKPVGDQVAFGEDERIWT
jgi:hypothetical protein